MSQLPPEVRVCFHFTFSDAICLVRVYEMPIDFNAKNNKVFAMGGKNCLDFLTSEKMNFNIYLCTSF